MGSQKPHSNRKPAARRRKATQDKLVPPAERLCLILQAYDQHALALPCNALVADRTPEEALKACRELAQWLFRTSYMAGSNACGEQHVYLTLSHALQSLEEQLKPLFEALRALAKAGT